MDRQRVLLIDGASGLEQLARAALVDDPLDLHVTAANRDWLPFLSELRPDLILIHAHPPFTDTVQLCRKILKETPPRLLPAMAIVADSDDHDRLLVLLPDCIQLMPSPASPPEMRKRITALLGRSSAGTRIPALINASPPDQTGPTHQALIESLEQDRAEVLEMIAADRPPVEVVRRLVDAAERLRPQAIAAAVVLFDGVLHLSDSHLPEDLKSGISRHLYTFAADFCTDASLDRSSTKGAPDSEASGVVVSNLLEHKAWEPVRDSVRRHGLQTCWSALIVSGRGDVLGMFGLYHMAPPAPPDPLTEALLRMAVRLIALAIEHRHLTDQLAHRAHHDALTGLPNRLLLEARLEQALTRAAADNRQIAVMFVDVDRFKVINDTLGHPAGDAMLCQLTARAQGCIGKQETLARMGGDEFALIMPEITDADDAIRRGRTLIDTLRAPMNVLGEELYVTVSIGLALYPHDGATAVQLQKNADAALYAAKNAGRDQLRMFEPSMNDGVRERLNLETALRGAVDQNQLRLFYQPQVDASGKILAVEALLRWQHPKLGLLNPGTFISLAEETGLIVPIGAWVLTEAARQAQAWAAAGIPRVPVAVNVSAAQFAQPDFLRVISGVLNTSKLPSQWLHLELTESVLMRNMHDATVKLQTLRDMGVCVAIDDFGTGYSSLAYLQRLPLHTLKIGETFVSVIRPEAMATIHENGRYIIPPPQPRSGRDEAAVIRAVIALARGLDLNVVAEGVETEAQRRFLQALGCPIMQGYLFSKPVPPEIAEPMLRCGFFEMPTEMAAKKSA